MKSFEKTLALTKLALRVSGLKIDKQTSNNIIHKFLDNLFYFNLIWLYTDVVSEFHWLVEGIQMGKDFEELTYIAPCITVTFLGTAKTVPLFLNMDLVIDLVEKFRAIHPNLSSEEDNIIQKSVGKKNKRNSHNIEKKYAELDLVVKDNEIKVQKEVVSKEMKIIDDSMKYLNYIIIFLFYTCCVVVTAFSCLPIIFMLINYVTKGETDIKYPLLCKYFFDASSGVMAVSMYFHQVWSTILAAFNVFGPDTLLYACCTFVQMHFRILKLRLEAIANEDQNLGKVRAGFVELVKRHQVLIDIVSRMEYLYAKSTLFNFISSSFLICLSGFNVTSIKEPGPVFSFATFLFMSLSQISMLCYCGDMIMKTVKYSRQSIEITDAAYNSRWYVTDSSLKKSIHIMIMRAHKPCKMTASNFADLNLGAFTTVLSRSWSYFALLKTVYK